MAAIAFIYATVSGNSHQHLGRLAKSCAGTGGAFVRCFAETSNSKGIAMIAKILGAIAGERIAGRNSKVTGALVVPHCRRSRGAG